MWCSCSVPAPQAGPPGRDTVINVVPRSEIVELGKSVGFAVTAEHFCVSPLASLSSVLHM